MEAMMSDNVASKQASLRQLYQKLLGRDKSLSDLAWAGEGLAWVSMPFLINPSFSSFFHFFPNSLSSITICFFFSLSSGKWHGKCPLVYGHKSVAYNSIFSIFSKGGMK